MDNQEWTMKNGQLRMDNQELTIKKHWQQWAQNKVQTKHTTLKTKSINNTDTTKILGVRKG